MIVVERAAQALQLKAPERQENLSSLEKTKSAFENVIDALIWICYVIQHALHYLLTLNFDGESIFQGRVLCHTHNYGKISELWSYIKLRRQPLPISNEISEIATQYGFKSTVNAQLSTTPHSGGICFGSVVHFFKKWFETRKDIIQVATSFDRGAPLEGVLYQEIYDSHLDDYYYPDLSDLIKGIIDSNALPSEQEIGDTPVARLLQGVRAYQKENHNPRKGEMHTWVRNWVQEQFALNLSGEWFATLRKVSSEYSSFFYASDMDRSLAIFEFARLKSDEVHVNSSPGEILRAIPNLQPGAYKLSFPCYSPLGREKKFGHTVAFVVQESGYSYFYDPNSCIACSNRNEVQATIGRLCTKYTGFDYSVNLDGDPPSYLKKISNFFCEEANPPSTQITTGFDLLRITESDL